MRAGNGDGRALMVAAAQRLSSLVRTCACHAVSTPKSVEAFWGPLEWGER